MAHPEFARMAVSPLCPRCGRMAFFMAAVVDHLAEVDAIMEVKCDCGWAGVSRRTIEQPPPPQYTGAD